jgi:hypothetical protein
MEMEEEKPGLTVAHALPKLSSPTTRTSDSVRSAVGDGSSKYLAAGVGAAYFSIWGLSSIVNCGNKYDLWELSSRASDSDTICPISVGAVVLGVATPFVLLAGKKISDACIAWKESRDDDFNELKEKYRAMDQNKNLSAEQIEELWDRLGNKELKKCNLEQAWSVCTNHDKILNEMCDEFNDSAFQDVCIIGLFAEGLRKNEQTKLSKEQYDRFKKNFVEIQAVASQHIDELRGLKFNDYDERAEVVDGKKYFANWNPAWITVMEQKGPGDSFELEEVK